MSKQKPRCRHDDGCSKYRYREGLCQAHYSEKHGLPRPRSRAELAEDLEWLLDTGETPERIVTRLGYADRASLTASLKRAGYGPLVKRFTEREATYA